MARRRPSRRPSRARAPRVRRRPRPSSTATSGSPWPSCTSRSARSPAFLSRAASARATGSRSGRPTHTTGSSPRSARTTPAPRSCPSTPATPATRPPTSCSARAPRRWSWPGRSSAPTGSPSCGPPPGPTGCPTCARVVQIPLDDSPVAGGHARLGRPRARWPPASPTADADARAAAVQPDDVSDILFTSGTTGRSKGVLSAHRQALDVARRLGRLRRGRRRRPLPGDQPVLPQLRLQGRHPRLPADRRDDRAAGGLRRRRARCELDRGRADHRAARRRRRSTRRCSTTPTAPATTCRRCGSRSPAPPPCRSRWSSGCRPSSSFDIVLTAYGLTEAVVATMCRARRPAELVARTSGRATAGFEVRIGEQRRAAAARPERHARLPRRPGRDRGRPSTPTAGCTPATSARSTTPAT